MRLLWRVEDDIFALTSFEGKQLPPYAVLSHTWIEGQEVTYDDIIIGAGKDKSDFAKLRFCSDQAAADGLQYFWIDTCCINRSSSIDLNVAINSRFRFFRHATKCYVYLADVSVPGTADPQFFQSRWVEAFRRSEWFKQGWTLQDLLAQEDIEFFSKEGKKIGNKTTLLREIYGITQIPIEALRGHSLVQYSVDEKLSWVASRQTTHEEDIVYCLLGILGVHLPVLYGEGKARAMQRLREAVQISQELEKRKKSKNSYRNKAQPVHLIPFPRNPNFINPGDFFDELEEKCSKLAPRVAIVGPAGTGKSELVLEHCYRTVERSPQTCVFWVAAGSVTEVEQGYRDIARRVDIKGWQEPEADIFNLVYIWLFNIGNPWIFVLDDLEDFSSHLDFRTRLPRDLFVPCCRHGSMIVTTRNRKAALTVVEQRDILTIESDHDTQHNDDRISVQSIESSTTLVSTFSDSTIVARSATVELEKVFQEDEELVDLYRLALKDTSMEPDKLQRNVARLLQFFAKDLRREAGGQLERLASRLVQSKAQYIAHFIVERLHDTPRDAPDQQTTSYKEKEEYRAAQFEVLEGQHQVNNEQTELDEVKEKAPVDEDHFEDLAMLRKFLIRSSAFQMFRARLTKFVLPKDLCILDVDSSKDRSAEAQLSKIRRLLILTSNIFKSLLVITGCLEPSLQPGFIRLRWQCECGAPLFEDVQEYRIGGVSRLIERMEKSTDGEVTATSYSKESSNQKYIPSPILWVREMARNVAKFFSRDEKCSDTLPQHNGSSITVTPASPYTQSPPVRDLLLLACMDENQGEQLLRQDSIGAISNDRQLFYFIRKQISHASNKRQLFRFLKSVTGIHFTQFHLRLNDDVEPRLHKLCCRQNACQCVPLTSNAEYDCTPAGPLDFGPPVLPSKMLHYFKHPDLISEKEMSILNQLPKRNCGKLLSTGQAPAEGWGLYYEENWNIGLMIVVFVGMTIFASLIFGVWWTLTKADIQGAWGVSSYMITACALVMGLVSIVGRASGG